MSSAGQIDGQRITRLADILRMEDSADVLDVRCPDTGIPLWSTIRIELSRLLLGDLLYGVPLAGAGGTRSALSYEAVSAVARSFVHNVGVLRAADSSRPVMIIASGTRLVQREGRYFNCLSGHFVSAFPGRTLAVEDLFGWRWPFPRDGGEVLLKTPLLVNGALRGRLRAARYRASACGLVDLVCRRVRDCVGLTVDEHRRRRLEDLCAIRSASLLPRYRAYRKLLARSGAQVLIKEEACYGGADDTSAMLAARHLGIVTAEYQHGAISSGHDAYNYAPAVAKSEAFRAILPDYFLSYGTWWTEQINVPIEKIAIGNPHRAETVASLGAGPRKQQQVLVLGDGIETEMYVDLCRTIASAAGPARRVVFRPHPLERARVRARYPDGSIGEVVIDSHQDIYSSLRDAEVVVSEVSTGLFEAIGLVPKIFIWDTPKAQFSYPSHPFHRFVSPEDLAGLLTDEYAGRVTMGQVDSIWAPRWRDNYRTFIEGVLARATAARCARRTERARSDTDTRAS